MCWLTPKTEDPICSEYVGLLFIHADISTSTESEHVGDWNSGMMKDGGDHNFLKSRHESISETSMVLQKLNEGGTWIARNKEMNHAPWEIISLNEYFNARMWKIDD